MGPGVGSRGHTIEVYGVCISVAGMSGVTEPDITVTGAGTPPHARLPSPMGLSFTPLISRPGVSLVSSPEIRLMVILAQKCLGPRTLILS